MPVWQWLSYESFPPTIKRKKLFQEELFFLLGAMYDATLEGLLKPDKEPMR